MLVYGETPLVPYVLYDFSVALTKPRLKVIVEKPGSSQYAASSTSG